MCNALCDVMRCDGCAGVLLTRDKRVLVSLAETHVIAPEEITPQTRTWGRRKLIMLQLIREKRRTARPVQSTTRTYTTIENTEEEQVVQT